MAKRWRTAGLLIVLVGADAGLVFGLGLALGASASYGRAVDDNSGRPIAPEGRPHE